jgi:hypothetical protein
MKDKVKEYLNSDLQKEWWDKIYNAFQEKGSEGINELLRNEFDKLKKEFEKLLIEIRNKIGG